ncbi:hypothetical protein NHQ30_001110 [Ciborinia camelliae]|nr:hypothetical protein NHQ30_001110 [Ciborinia camelliae]
MSRLEGYDERMEGHGRYNRDPGVAYGLEEEEEMSCEGGGDSDEDNTETDETDETGHETKREDDEDDDDCYDNHSYNDALAELTNGVDHIKSLYDENPNIAGKARSFAAKSAADALLFAVKSKFDIIPISWTVQKADNGEDIQRLLNAIQAATNSDILIFCSAPDTGHVRQENLPSIYPFGDPNIANIFKIGAATADSSAFDWLDNPELTSKPNSVEV